MSYNTWPAFNGRGWNIKKRPYTRTIVHTSDGGAEYRLARYQSPLYEFDIEIPYLSAQDYATLQAFFYQQGGPFTPFYFAPDNDAANATVFASGSSGGTSFQLTRADGQPATDNVSVLSLYQTDWQGRVQLSSGPRTNILLSSEDFSATSNWGYNAVNYTLVQAAHALIPGTTAWTHTDVGGGSKSVATNGNIGNYSAGMETLTIIIENVNAAITDFGALASSGWIHLQRYNWATDQLTTNAGSGTGTVTQLGTGPNGGKLVKLTTTYNAASAAGQARNAYFYLSGVTPNTNSTIPYAAQLEIGSVAGAIIATTTAPVTVTDYTLNPTGVITLGQAPVGAYTLDWTGTYSYVVRFKDDNIEATQTMSQIYEATTITLRSVR